MRGNVTRRGKSSWRLKFDLGRDPVTGKRKYYVQTVRGKRQDAEKALSRLLNSANEGMLVEPAKITVAEYLRSWLTGPHGLAAKTAERYGELVERQIIPHLGTTALQKLKPAQIANWHAVLLKNGGNGGRPLSARTVGHAHRVLHRSLERAVKAEIVARNVASAIPPPKVEVTEVEILAPGQIAALLAGLEGHSLHPIAVIALSTGIRRGELLGLQWADVDFDAGVLRVERSLEETKQGLRLKVPKTRNGRRGITLPPIAIDALRSHWKRQMEIRLALGRGRSENGAFVFCGVDGSPLSPDNLSRDWRVVTDARALPRVRFHALRHTHASALISGGLDVLTVSRRLGHGSPVITLSVYAHQFEKTDGAAAKTIEAALRPDLKR